MEQKGFSLPSLIGAIFLLAVACGVSFYLGMIFIKAGNNSPAKNLESEGQQISDKLNQEIAPTLNPMNASTSSDHGPQAEILSDQKKLKTTQDLPQIAQAAIDYELKKGNKNPAIEFASNDGEYATVSLHEVGVGGGYLDFLVKRDNRWLVVWQGNGIPSCAEITPVRTKYNISKTFLQCAEEMQ